MQLVINGKADVIEDKVTVTDLLRIRQVKMPDMVTVELNGEILERKAFNEVVLKDGDRIEFLYFMGGGRSNESY
jgi:sulfur carrier protein